MNFTQVIQEGDVAVELKYCERCGGLWLRRIHDDESSCDSCRAAMTAWPRIGRILTTRRNVNHGVPFGVAQGRHKEGRGNTVSVQELVIETLLGVAERPNGEPELFTDIGEVRV